MYNRFHQLTFLMRLRPFDTSTPEGRSQERYRRILWTTTAAAIAKGVTALTTIISMPLTLGYLDKERWGLWVTISTAFAMLGFSDLGLGNGLLNAMAEADGRDDREEMKRCVSSAFFMLCGMACLLGLIFFLGLYPFLPWAWVFNVASPQALSELRPSILVVATIFLANIPMGIVVRIQQGLQEGFANSIWTAVGNLAGLALVLLAIWRHASLPWLILGLAGGPTIELAINCVCFFGIKHRSFIPRWRHWSAGAARKMLGLGVYFLVLQVCVSLSMTSDNMIVAHLPKGTQGVPDYAVPWRLFSVVSMVLGLAMAPLWPAYGEAISRGDLPWVRRTLRRSILICLLFSGAVALVFVLTGKHLVGILSHHTVTPSLWLLLGLACWTVIGNTCSVISMFLNGVGAMREQMVIAIIMAVTALALKIILGAYLGIAGVVWAMVIVFLVIVIPWFFYLVPRTVRGLGNRKPLLPGGFVVAAPTDVNRARIETVSDGG